MRSEAFDDPRLTAVGLFMEAHQGLISKLTPRFQEHGLSLTEFEVLLRLARTPNQRLRMSDLAAQTSLSTSGITRVVDRLERDGLVVREITATGTDRVGSVIGGHLDDVENWFTGLLGPGELRALTDALRVVRDAVHPDAVAGSEPVGSDALAG
jgi:hypothetical protein